MRINADRKRIKKAIIEVIIMGLLFSPSAPLWAEDYPSEYLGSGYREYLGDKIRQGYDVQEFSRIDRLQKERMDKRNQVENMVSRSHQTGTLTAQGISELDLRHKDNSQKLDTEIAQLRNARQNVAGAQGEFTYIPYSDGKIVYFKDGLVSRVENERVLDEFGNVSIRNSKNYQYNDKRLMTGFEADIKDVLGNLTHIRQYGMQYTGDSLFYATKETNAVKNITEYTVEEIDRAGNQKVTHFYGASYEGKFQRAFSQTIEDSIYGKTSFTRTNITYAGNNPDQPTSYYEEGIGTDGLAYTLDRTNITYNGEKNQLIGYREVMRTTQIDGNVTITTVDAQFKYLGVANQFGPDVEEPEPDRLLESVIRTITENSDGSKNDETATTQYKYESNKLIGASGHSEFIGQEADWWYEETQTYKEGNKYKGTSDTQYEILYGKPVNQKIHSNVSYYGQNISPDELQRVEDFTIIYNNLMVTYNGALGTTFSKIQQLDSQEHTEITSPLLDPDNSHKEIRDINTTYYYDEKGNFDAERGGAYGAGKANGWEYSSEQGWYGKYTSIITVDYITNLGKVLIKKYSEYKDYE